MNPILTLHADRIYYDESSQEVKVIKSSVLLSEIYAYQEYDGELFSIEDEITVVHTTGDSRCYIISYEEMKEIMDEYQKLLLDITISKHSK